MVVLVPTINPIKSLTKKVNSHVGAGAIVLFAIAIPASAIALYLQIQTLLKEPRLFSNNDFVVTLAALIAIVACINWIRTRIVVEPSQVTHKSLWRNSRYSTSDISKIVLFPTGYFLWVLHLTLRESGRLIVLQPFFMHNEDELIKAITEAAFVANPNVVVDKRITDKYGFPPYGIFYQKAKVNSDG
jgi:hypothetical protein